MEDGHGYAPKVDAEKMTSPRNSHFRSTGKVNIQPLKMIMLVYGLFHSFFKTL